MRIAAAGFALMTLVSQSLAAQQPKPDSAVARRPERSILVWAEVVGIAAIAGMAFSRDQLLRDRLHDPHDALGRTLSDLGNGFGDGAVVYKHLFLELPGVCLPETTNYPTVAAAVARLGEDRFRSNRVDDLGALTPAYVRPSEAEFKRGSSL